MAIFIAIVLFSIAPLAILNYISTRSALIETSNQTLLAAASQAAAAIDSFMIANLDAVRTEAQLPDLVEYLSASAGLRNNSPAANEASGALRSLSRKDQINIESYALVDRDGQVLLSTAPLSSNPNVAGEDFFKGAVTTGVPYATSLLRDDQPGKTVLFFSTPVRGPVGDLAGVLVVRYNGAILQQIINRTNNVAGSQSYAALIDSDGVYLAHGAQPDVVLRPLALPDPAALARLQAARQVADLPADQLSTNQGDLAGALADERARFFAARVTPGSDELQQAAVASSQSLSWRVVVARPQAAFLEPVESQARTTVLLALGLLAGVAALAFLASQFLTRPIARLTSTVERFQSGDLLAQAEIGTHDEIGTLATTFNAMAANLRQMVGSLEQQVSERTGELRSALSAQEAQASELQAALATQEKLNTLVLELAAPLIPIRAGVLVVPLSGFVNAAHVQESLSHMLSQIEAQRAHTVMIDVTGIPVMDTAVAGALLQAAQTARLLGAELVLVGIRPDVAQTLVSLGADLSAIQTWSTLQQALDNIKR
ncbi:MAG TPA: cache domain-containing protein [Herpetosiphonaceae bacterium]